MTAITGTEHRTQTNAQRPALVNSIEHALERAAEQSYLAYQFNPNSYTHGALNAVNALRVSVKRLLAEGGAK